MVYVFPFSFLGHYLIVQNRPGATSGDTAILESSLYYESSAKCVLNFWYNTFASTGTKVNVIAKSAQDRLTTLWTLTANSKIAWQSATVQVGAYRNFAFDIEVVFPSGSVGTVAIDDISFSNCAPSMYFSLI